MRLIGDGFDYAAFCDYSLFQCAAFVGDLCSTLHNSAVDDVEFIFVDDMSTDDTEKNQSIRQYRSAVQLSENKGRVFLKPEITALNWLLVNIWHLSMETIW